MLVFQSVGGRIPQDYTDPLVQTVWPVCSGEVPLPYWRFDGERFSQNLTNLIAQGSIDRLPARWQFVQFLPLALLQVIAMLGLFAFARNGDLAAERQPSDVSSPARTKSDLAEPAPTVYPDGGHNV